MADGHWIVCGMGVVHPWLCDAMGHLTTRHFLGMFDDASYHLFAALGYDPAEGKRTGQGWADVSHRIDYKAELGSGALVRITGRIAAVGRSSLTSEFRMVESGEDRICATLEARTVCFDLEARRARPLPDRIVDNARDIFGAVRSA
jgi:acyl-CoA thioester hydrolase